MQPAQNCFWGQKTFLGPKLRSAPIVPARIAPGAAVLRIAQFLLCHAPEIAAKENQEVQQREQHAEAVGPCAEHKPEQAQNAGKQSQPFHFNRNDEKQ